MSGRGIKCLGCYCLVLLISMETRVLSLSLLDVGAILLFFSRLLIMFKLRISFV